MNLGCFFSPNLEIIRLNNDHLLAMGYLMNRFDIKRCQKFPENCIQSLRSVRVLYQELNRQNIPTCLILAPTKELFFHDSVPWYYKWFIDKAEKHIPQLPPDVTADLSCEQYVFPVEKLRINNEGLDCFPYSGIHWNIYGAAITLCEAMLKIHQQAPTIPVPEIDAVFDVETPVIFQEYDLANLLNQFIPYIEKGKNFKDLEFKPLRIEYPIGKVFLLCDSYGEELEAALIKSKLCKKENIRRVSIYKPLTKEDREFVYSKNTVFLTCLCMNNLAYGFLKQRSNELLQSCTDFYFDRPNAVITQGVSIQEPGGRWTDGNRIVLDIPLDKQNDFVGDLTLMLTGDPMVGRNITQQNLIFFVGNEQIGEMVFSHNSTQSITIPAKICKGKKRLKLTIKIPNATVPPGYENIPGIRHLGLFITKLTISGK